MSTTQNAGPSWLAPYEVCKGVDIVERRQAKLERHEILHYIRGSLEEHHRSQLETFQIHYPHLLKDMSHLDEVMGLNCWNKTVPIYLLRGPQAVQVFLKYFGLPSTTTSIASGSALTVPI
jgi:hypothetical protein